MARRKEMRLCGRLRGVCNPCEAAFVVGFGETLLAAK